MKDIIIINHVGGHGLYRGRAPDSAMFANSLSDGPPPGEASLEADYVHKKEELFRAQWDM